MIKIEHVSKTYHSREGNVEALKDINLEIKDGEIYGIIGHSGSGKSTLIRCINRLEQVDKGKIIVGEDDMVTLTEAKLRRKRQKISMIFQQFNLLKNSTVYQNVAMPLAYIGMGKKEIEEKVDELLKLVGLSDKKNSYPAQLSGGQKQRVAIARALANDPEVLLSDESTSALDPETTQSILSLLRDLNEKLNITIVLIAHQMEVIKDICHCVAVLSDGEVVEQGNTLEVFVNSENPTVRQFADSLFHSNQIEEVLRNPEIRKGIFDGARIIHLLFHGDCANQSIIARICRRYDIDANIIFGNIVLFGSEPVGNLYLALAGKEEQIEAGIDYIRKKEVFIQYLDDEFLEKVEVTA